MMQIHNPFESGHIKNYILLYVSVVVIVLLFFVAAKLFFEIKQEPKKEFNLKTTKKIEVKKVEAKEQKPQFTPKFKLLEQGYS